MPVMILAPPRVAPDDAQHYINQGGMELAVMTPGGSWRGPVAGPALTMPAAGWWSSRSPRSCSCSRSMMTSLERLAALDARRGHSERALRLAGAKLVGKIVDERAMQVGAEIERHRGQTRSRDVGQYGGA